MCGHQFHGCSAVIGLLKTDHECGGLEEIAELERMWDLDSDVPGRVE